MAGDVLATDVMAYLTGLEPQRPPQPSDLPAATRRYRVVGNLPYNIASPILFRLLAWHETHGMPVDATVMVQREVADRLTAKPGTKAYGVLTVLVRLHADVHRLFDLPPGAFHPRPKVQSSVIRLVFRPPTVLVRDIALFERMVKAMFGQRRKTLANALKAFRPDAREILAESRLDGRRRPATQGPVL
jgi:16S rRNA (adenine1518-N6/adenine1519-N6)-dimethyltransferase